MYLDLLDGNTVFLHKYLWKMKVPLKIKIFMRFLHRQEFLTKDNLVKRNWLGSKKCCFVIMRRRHNIFLSSVLLLKLFGTL
jgi:hypothetical protein